MGSWNIEKMDSSFKINYKLEAKPDFFSPDFLTNGAFKRNVETLLKEVKKEILSRAQE